MHECKLKLIFFHKQHIILGKIVDHFVKKVEVTSLLLSELKCDTPSVTVAGTVLEQYLAI
jgi:hypothetical protein